VATVRASKVDTDTTGANCAAEVTGARLLTRTMTEKTKVARNKPSVTRVIRERMKIRTVLGVQPDGEVGGGDRGDREDGRQKPQ